MTDADATGSREDKAETAKTAAALRLVLLEAERSLMDGSTRTSRPRLEALLSEAFVEVGASGRRYSRSQTIEALAREVDTPSGTIDDFQLVWHDDGAALVSYRYSTGSQGTGPQPSSRVSFWVREGAAWKILYHQGNPLPPNSKITK